MVIVLAAALGFLYRFWFLRMPERHIPQLDNIFVSPANGTVSGIQKWSGDTAVIEKNLRSAVPAFTGSVGDSGYIVSIVMLISDVHYQRAPIKCRLVKKIYSPGLFDSATRRVNKYGVRFGNESNQMLFETERGTRFKVIQIAGLLARKIVDYIEPGQQMKQGDIIGLIRFGSQVTLILPANVELRVKEGDVVVDGETIIAEEILLPLTE